MLLMRFFCTVKTDFFFDFCKPFFPVQNSSGIFSIRTAGNRPRRTDNLSFQRDTAASSVSGCDTGLTVQRIHDDYAGQQIFHRPDIGRKSRDTLRCRSKKAFFPKQFLLVSAGRNPQTADGKKRQTSGLFLLEQADSLIGAGVVSADDILHTRAQSCLYSDFIA